MNRVEVFSSTTASRVAQVSVPGASSADLSADGTTVWIGTVTKQVAAIDTSSLQVKARYEIAGLQPLPNTLFDRPEELLALSNGNLMMRLRQVPNRRSATRSLEPFLEHADELNLLSAAAFSKWPWCHGANRRPNKNCGRRK